MTRLITENEAASLIGIRVEDLRRWDEAQRLATGSPGDDSLQFDALAIINLATNSIKFRFQARPIEWVFQFDPAAHQNVVAIAESDARRIEVGRITYDHLTVASAERSHWISQGYLKLHGSSSQPFYNGVSGREHERGWGLTMSGNRMKNLPVCGASWWGDNPALDPGRMTHHFVGERDVVGVIEESWKYPGKSGWVTETAFIVVPDRLLEMTARELEAVPC